MIDSDSWLRKNSGVFLLHWTKKISPKKSPPKKRRKNAEKILKGMYLDKASCINTFFYEGRGYDEKSRKNFAFFLS